MGLCNMTHAHDTCILFLLLKSFSLDNPRGFVIHTQAHWSINHVDDQSISEPASSLLASTHISFCSGIPVT